MNYQVILTSCAFAVAAFWAVGIIANWHGKRMVRRYQAWLYNSLGTMRWMGADEGWELAIEAVRKEIDPDRPQPQKEQPK
jgi:hypothetical protein